MEENFLGLSDFEWKITAIYFAFMGLLLIFILIASSRSWTKKKLEKLEEQEKYLASKGGIAPKFFKSTNQENIEKSKKCDFSTK